LIPPADGGEQGEKQPGIYISNYMSEKFGEEGGYDEFDGSRSSFVEDGDFMVADNEQNDLMIGSVVD
jgi:hypothetical protein